MMNTKQSTAIWWIRGDLRLENNPALNQALRAGYTVLPLFIFDPVIENSPRMGSSRMRFLQGGLLKLKNKIYNSGGNLIVRRGQPDLVLGTVLKESGAERIFAQGDLTPYARRRDRQVSKKMPLELISGATYSPPDQITSGSGDPYQVYSHYRNKWKKLNLKRLRSVRLSNPPLDFYSEKLPGIELDQKYGDFSESGFVPGEDSARSRLQEFTAGEAAPVYSYREQRNRPDLSGTSRLSPYLHFGMISITEAFLAALEAMDRTQNQTQLQSAETWLDELIWREFFQYILYHNPQVLRYSYREKLAAIPWRNDREEFSRWKAGRTGFPIVDAAMRQLTRENWMHNRTRMVTASFLVKDLLIDWRWGEDWFMESLLDADLASNNGGWQWVAGTGTDAAPYFRIFNPITQGEKHDPQGRYIREFVPELRQVPGRYIHQPWTMPESVQQESECVIGKDYPPPMVDHSEARKRTLEAYQFARDSIT
jgi:deoxyribodipyrimidine photo-lyase